MTDNRFALDFEAETARPAGQSRLRWLEVPALILIAGAGPALVLGYALDWDSTGLGTPSVARSLAAATAELLTAIAAAIALAVGATRNRRLVRAGRGASAWLLASGIENVSEAVKWPHPHPHGGWWFTLIAGGALIGGSVLLLLAGVPAGVLPKRFPVPAAVALVVAVAEGLYFIRGTHLNWHGYLIGLAVAGTLLLAGNTTEPHQEYVWLGWSAVGAVHVWAFGGWLAGLTVISTEHLWWSSVGPMVIAAMAALWSVSSARASVRVGTGQ